jgi:hypothetical protein
MLTSYEKTRDKHTSLYVQSDSDETKIFYSFDTSFVESRILNTQIGSYKIFLINFSHSKSYNLA